LLDFSIVGGMPKDYYSLFCSLVGEKFFFSPFSFVFALFWEFLIAKKLYETGGLAVATYSALKFAMRF